MWQKTVLLLTGAASRLLGWSRACPVDGRLTALPEVGAVRLKGYEIVFQHLRASRQVRQYTLRATLRGLAVGRLDVDYLPGRRLLYVANVYVAEAHGRKGVGAALLLSAALTTHCAAVATSGRTRQGTAFFAKSRATLARHGVALWDRAPRAG
jgi:GNAT superfamily N-acetyltransferase